MKASVVPFIVLLGASVAAGDTVERRGGAAAVSGQVTKMDDAGLTMNGDVFVRWDQVRTVHMDRPDPALENYLDIAGNLWRARTRLERNDAAMAEPLFERLFERYRGKSNETALLVAEGLLRCRLARGANDAAVIPALEAARLQNKKFAINAFPSVVIDETTLLCVLLPPVWVNSSALIKLERDLGSYDAQGDLTVSAMASLYQRAIQQQMGMAVKDEGKPLAADHPGVKMLRAMVDLSSPDASRRQTTRESQFRNIDGLPVWAQAWAHYLVGISLVNETGLGRQQQGMVELAHLPARHALEQPFLTGLALLRLAGECERTGETNAAATLRAEFAARFPSHPALNAALRGSTARTNGTTAETQPASQGSFKETP